MTRKECLDKAAECVLRDRNNSYGKPEDCFGMIARMWGAYLGVCISAHDVAAMMALLKIARFRHNPFHEDNAVDCAGYAACMIETATAWEREQAEEQGPQDGDEVVVLWKRKDKAEGVEELVVSPFDEDRMRESMPGIVPQDGPSDMDAMRPHCPTGEELAEMAEEDAHG